MMSWQTLVAIASGGAFGAILRAYLNGSINKALSSSFPFGTLGVNLLGSLIIGILFCIFANSNVFSPTAKSFLTTGFLGALTTYSTFAIETFWLLQGGSYLMATLNLTLNAIGSIFMASLGYKCCELLFRI